METERHNSALAKALYSAASDSSAKPLPASATQQAERRKAVMVALWKRLREYFGQGWVRSYGDVDGEAIKAWTDALASFTEAQIARGVRSCQDWRKDFPPTLGQFQELCLTVRPEERPVTRYVPDPETPLLDRVKGKELSEIGKRELEKFQRLMAGLTAKDPGNEGLPTFEGAYHALGLGTWWGPLASSRDAR